MDGTRGGWKSERFLHSFCDFILSSSCSQSFSFIATAASSSSFFVFRMFLSTFYFSLFLSHASRSMRVRLPLLKLFTFVFNKNFVLWAIPVYCFPFFFSAYFLKWVLISFIRCRSFIYGPPSLSVSLLRHRQSVVLLTAHRSTPNGYYVSDNVNEMNDSLRLNYVPF